MYGVLSVWLGVQQIPARQRIASLKVIRWPLLSVGTDGIVSPLTARLASAGTSWLAGTKKATASAMDITSVIIKALNMFVKRISFTYDQEADVLYLNFKKPSHADDSELTDDDIIIRYEKGNVVGITILHASQRRRSTKKRRGERNKPSPGAATGRKTRR